MFDCDSNFFFASRFSIGYRLKNIHTVNTKTHSERTDFLNSNVSVTLSIFSDRFILLRFSFGKSQEQFEYKRKPKEKHINSKINKGQLNDDIHWNKKETQIFLRPSHGGGGGGYKFIIDGWCVEISSYLEVSPSDLLFCSEVIDSHGRQSVPLTRCTSASITLFAVCCCRRRIFSLSHCSFLVSYHLKYCYIEQCCTLCCGYFTVTVQYCM